MVTNKRDEIVATCPQLASLIKDTVGGHTMPRENPSVVVDAIRERVEKQ